MSPDLAGATQYALERLSRDLPPQLCYHGVEHTRDDVAPMSVRLAAESHIHGIDLLLLQTAAYFHDIGFVTQRAGHEEAGIAIATAILPTFGYHADHVQHIADIIRATQVPQHPRSLLGAILADADLDVLGRDDFFTHNRILRQELDNYGEHHTDLEWYSRQLAFLQQHRYWTPAARRLRDATKKRNQEQLAALLTEAHKQHG
jgi:uncharacterized protein